MKNKLYILFFVSVAAIVGYGFSGSYYTAHPHYHSNSGPHSYDTDSTFILFPGSSKKKEADTLSTKSIPKPNTIFIREKEKNPLMELIPDEK